MNSVRQIHESFDSSLGVLERSLSRISEYNKNLDNSERYNTANALISVGFAIAKPVLKSGTKVNSIPSGMMESIIQYKEKLPLNGLILLSQVYRLCEQYGLYFGGSNLYAGDIPRKNVNDILEFSKIIGSGKNYYVCAPLSEFNLKNTIISGHRISYKEHSNPKFKFLAPKVKDPIILCYLRRFDNNDQLMAIVSKWGPESEYVQNPIEN